MYINITLNGNTAELGTPVAIVCGNSNYVIKLTRGEDWHENVWCRMQKRQRGVIDSRIFIAYDDEIELPVLDEVDYIELTFKDNETTETAHPLIIPCVCSCRDYTGKEVEPKEDVYNYIMGQVHEIVG